MIMVKANTFLKVLIMFFIVIYNGLVSGEGRFVEKKEITPDPVIQSELKLFNNATTEEEFYGALGKLKKLGGKDYEKLIPQLMYYKTKAIDTKEAMLMGVVIEQLNISERCIVKGLMPYLGTEDLRLKHDMEEGIINSIPFEVIADCFLPVINQQKKDPPKSLIKYLYRRNPGKALTAIVPVYITDDIKESYQILSSSKNISYALPENPLWTSLSPEAAKSIMKEIELLSSKDEWFIQLCIAEILRQRPQFRQEWLIEKLEKCKHPLVQETMWEISARPALENKRREISIKISTLDSFTRVLGDSAIMKDAYNIGLKDWQGGKAESFNTAEELKIFVDQMEREINSFILSIKKRIIAGEIPFDKACLQFLKVRGEKDLKGFIIGEILTDPEVVKKASKEELEELENILVNLSEGIPQANKVLEIIKNSP